MQQNMHHEFENFFNTATQENRNSSHGSLRSKTKYGYLSVSRISRGKQEFNLTIFLPHVGKCVSFSWSNRKGVQDLQYPQNINRTQAFNLLIKALKKNEENLIRHSGNFGLKYLKGVYLWRLDKGKRIGKTGMENFKKAFNGSIPNIFINECRKAKITLKTYKKDGETPFEFSLMNLKNILS